MLRNSLQRVSYQSTCRSHHQLRHCTKRLPLYEIFRYKCCKIWYALRLVTKVLLVFKWLLRSRFWRLYCNLILIKVFLIIWRSFIKASAAFRFKSLKCTSKSNNLIINLFNTDNTIRQKNILSSRHRKTFKLPYLAF